MNQNPTNCFSPDITDYMIAAGFRVHPAAGPNLGGLMFLNEAGDCAVAFWRDKIQVNQGYNFELTHSYKGFDGRNAEHMMMILHVMGVVTLQMVRQLAEQERSPLKAAV